jgi:hypothetical protein
MAMKNPLYPSVVFLVMVVTASCRAFFPDSAADPGDGYHLSNILAHAVVRMAAGGPIYSVVVDDVGVFGISSSRAVVYGCYLVAYDRDLPDHPRQVPLLLLTCDGGRTWTQSTDPAEPMRGGYVKEIRFINEKCGWISATYRSCCGPGSFLLRTGDGGTTWDAAPSYHQAHFAFWSFESAWKGTAVIDVRDSGKLLMKDGELIEPYRVVAYEVLRTTNGGRTWEVAESILVGDDESFEPDTVAPTMKSLPPDPSWSLVETDQAWIVRHTDEGKTTSVAEIPIRLLDREYRFGHGEDVEPQH